MKGLLIAAVLLSGCSLQLEDKRLTRDEVVYAFKQRDQQIVALAEALKKVEARLPDAKKGS